MLRRPAALVSAPGPALVLVALLTLAVACGSDGRPRAKGRSSATTGGTTASSATTVTGPTSSTGAGASTTSSSPGPPDTHCATSQLRAALGFGQGAAGNLYAPLTLTNTSARTCTLTGYPGVSVLDAGGNQIGPAATREPGQSPTTITLAPGAVANTILHTINQGVSPAGCLAPSTQVRVFPPDERDALTTPGSFQICGGVFAVSAIAAGTGG